MPYRLRALYKVYNGLITLEYFGGAVDTANTTLNATKAQYDAFLAEQADYNKKAGFSAGTGGSDAIQIEKNFKASRDTYDTNAVDGEIADQYDLSKYPWK